MNQVKEQEKFKKKAIKLILNSGGEKTDNPNYQYLLKDYKINIYADEELYHVYYEKDNKIESLFCNNINNIYSRLNSLIEYICKNK